MTIVTKPKTEKKPLVNHEVEGGECVVVDPQAAAAVDEEAWLSSTARRRVSTATSVCVSITVLLIMSIGIIGGVYLYRQFSAHEEGSEYEGPGEGQTLRRTNDREPEVLIDPDSRARFRGWCGIPYDHEALLGNPKLPLEGNYGSSRGMAYKSNNDAEWISRRLFKEEFELDLEEDDYEEIHVPDFGLRRQGRFIHDFKVNKTGIIDFTTHRCYVMPLDRNHVLPPRSVYDLIKKMWMGYYSVDTQVVRETMRVVRPPIKDYQPLGVYITNYCATFPTYNLEHLHVHDMKKRSVDQLDTFGEKGIQFAEFAGKNIVHFIILGADEDEISQQ
ncbi:integral membrane protein 2B-like isoform X1 [Eriocheir sinensis]|uniref:integral membrane protein 2B-like isoform X1 n=1 Tax=Eriocheir sinensis TaxID=95602 RepID=UPI0021C62EF6|nr:integral membrane protein 2B-like isoform X1 [Eriocheir sinensis]